VIRGHVIGVRAIMIVVRVVAVRVAIAVTVRVVV
jgi:hypothetical protein